MKKSEFYKLLTNCENTAAICDEVINTKKVLQLAKTENREVAVKCAMELEKAINDKKINNREGGEFYVHHFLKMFEAMPNDKKSALFDEVSRQTLSVREAEWYAVKHIISMPFGAARTTFIIESKRKNGEGGFEILPFKDIDFKNAYEIEAAKLHVIIKPLRGVNTNAAINYGEKTAKTEKTENK